MGIGTLRFDDDFGMAHGGGEGDRLGRQHFPADALLLGKLLGPIGICLQAKSLPPLFALIAMLGIVRTIWISCWHGGQIGQNLMPKLMP